jgi:hypothetical protein
LLLLLFFIVYIVVRILVFAAVAEATVMDGYMKEVVVLVAVTVTVVMTGLVVMCVHAMVKYIERLMY